MCEELADAISILNLQDHSLPALLSPSISSKSSLHQFLTSLHKFVSVSTQSLPSDYLRFLLSLATVPELQVRVSSILVNLTAGPMCTELVSMGILQLLREYTHQTNAELVEQAYWCFSNIAATDALHRDLVSETVFIQQARTVGIQQKILWMLSNILKQEPFPAQIWYEISINQCKNAILCKELQNDVLGLLSSILLDVDYISQIFEYGIAEYIMDLEDFDEYFYFSILYSLTSGTDTEVNFLINHHIIKIYTEYLLNSDKDIQNLILQGLYNLSLGPPAHIFHLLSSGIISNLANILQNPCINPFNNAGICVEILCELCKSKGFLEELVNSGVVELFIKCIENDFLVDCCICGLYQFINTNYIGKPEILRIFNQLLREDLGISVGTRAQSLLLLLNR